MTVATASTRALKFQEHQRWNFKLVVFLCCFREAGPSGQAPTPQTGPASDWFQSEVGLATEEPDWPLPKTSFLC